MLAFNMKTLTLRLGDITQAEMGTFIKLVKSFRNTMIERGWMKDLQYNSRWAYIVSKLVLPEFNKLLTQCYTNFVYCCRQNRNPRQYLKSEFYSGKPNGFPLVLDYRKTNWEKCMCELIDLYFKFLSMFNEEQEFSPHNYKLGTLLIDEEEEDDCSKMNSENVESEKRESFLNQNLDLRNQFMN